MQCVILPIKFLYTLNPWITAARYTLALDPYFCNDGIVYFRHDTASFASIKAQ